MSVGQHSVKADPKVSHVTCSFTPSNVTANISLPAALLSKVCHNFVPINPFSCKKITPWGRLLLKICKLYANLLFFFDFISYSISSWQGCCHCFGCILGVPWYFAFIYVCVRECMCVCVCVVLCAYVKWRKIKTTVWLKNCKFSAQLPSSGVYFLQL